MGSPERVRSSMKRDTEDDFHVKSRVRDDDEAKGRSRKLEDYEEYEVLDGSERKRTTGNRNENRKRSSGSSRIDSNEYDYDVTRESRSKQGRKELEGSTLEKLSNWYQDGEGKTVYGGDRGSSLSVDGERRRTSSKFLDYDGSQTRSRGKDEKLHHGDPEKALERDYRYSEKRGSEKENVCGSSDAQNSRRKWDELDASRDADESNHVNLNDKGSENSCGTKLGAFGDKVDSFRIEASNNRGRDLGLDGEKDSISMVREERRSGSEWSNTGNSEAVEENYRGGSTCNDRSGKGNIEKPKQIKISSGWDVVDGQDGLFNTDDGSSKSMREKVRIGTESSNISRTPERSDKHHCDPESFEMDYDRTNAYRRKEEKEHYKDYELRGRDDGQSDKNRDNIASKDTWRRRQSVGEKERNDGDVAYNHGRDWELPRRGHDNDKPQGRSFGGRKDGNRTEAIKTSSKYGISNENYDVIEIQTKPLDDGREKSRPVAGLEAVQQSVTLVSNNNEDAYAREDRAGNVSVSGHSDDDLNSRLVDDSYGQDPKLWKDDTESQAGNVRDQKGALSSHSWSGQGFRSGSVPPQGNYNSSSLNRGIPQGKKGNSTGKGGRGRLTGRDSQPVGLHMPMIGSAFGHLGMPPLGAMQSHFSSMSPAPVPPISPGMFIPPFSPPFIWPGARGGEMNILSVPPGPSGLTGPWFPPSQVNPPNPTMYFNQPSSGQGAPLSNSGSNFMTHGHGQPPDAPGGWTPSRTSVPPGKAPSRGEQNDYSQNFVDTGMRPQNFIRELELTSVVEDYPKLRELIQRKDEIVSKVATPPMYLKCDLLEKVLSPELFGTKFDVILIDPPWEEYVHRAPGVTDHVEYWNVEDIMKLKIEEIADTPSFLFLWVGDGFGLEQGRQCLKKWGFRRCEDISWVKTNKTNATPGLRHDSHTLFQRSKEHCLMGIRGTVRRGPDGHIIHANIDTDVIIAEEPPYGSTAKPEDMYRIIEHFALGRRRLELFGEDHNIRSGWLTVGKGLSSSNFSAEAYCRSFADIDGKVWQGAAGRNPPPEAPHLVQTTPEIEALRPKSPMKNQQQSQQQSASISLTTTNSLNKRIENSPQNYNAPNLNQEGFSSNMSRSGSWASPVESFKRDGGHIASSFR